ncbi:MAG: crosslink repair DNA glycosylase YcaQ family protein, partial [Propionicimonas sp.]
MDRDGVLARRLATQRLSGPPAADPMQVVRELLAVQSQDAPLARAMVAQRCVAGSVAAVEAAVAAGDLIRTHILRPTWHYVAAADLRWLLDLTSPPPGAPMGARERQLGIDHALVDRALAALTERLSGRRFAARAALGDALVAAGVLDRGDPLLGQQVGHLLGFAEFRAVVCSAPVETTVHHYALVDEVVPPAPPRRREDALAELVERFVAGHGPVAIRELQRWTR